MPTDEEKLGESSETNTNDTPGGDGDPVEKILGEIKAAMTAGPDAEPFYHLINDIIEKTASMRAGRSKTWGQTLQKATFKRDENAWLGIKPSFSIADSLTDISDKTLETALSHIHNFMTKPDEMPEGTLAGIKQFADRLPSSDYKKSIDMIYNAGLFCSLAMLTIAFPIVAPITIPMMVPLCLVAGSAIMGVACHMSFKTFLNHVAEERYEAERFHVLESIHGIEKELAPSEEGALKCFSSIKSAVSELLTEIQAAKKNGKISIAESANALKIINQVLKGDKKALSDLEHLQDSMRFSFLSKDGMVDSMRFFAESSQVAIKKYPVFAAFVAVASIAQVGLAIVSPSFLLQLGYNVVIGVAAVAGYELTNATCTAKTNESDFSEGFRAAKDKLNKLYSPPEPDQITSDNPSSKSS